MIKNTFGIQYASLLMFMRQLGYERILHQDGREQFYHRDYTISPNTAIAMHNGEWVDDFDLEKGYLTNTGFPHVVASQYIINMAEAGKVVEKVKLQWSKREKRYVVQSYIVKFKEDVYYDLMEMDK